jgi:phospholipid transport system transporter-binding protein
MPSTDGDAVAATLRRAGDTLHLGGALVTAAIAGLWSPALAAVEGASRIDVGAVTRVDSAGVAFLAELMQRAGASELDGEPPGLSALRAAYRLTPALAYAG